MSLTPLLKKIENSEDLSTTESQSAFDAIFEGKETSENIATFLAGLHKKGETVNELFGAVSSMRRKMLSIKAPHGTMDIVGTGGDNHGTYNISTAVALVVASCGVPVAKHGNRAASSKSGSSDILAALGIKLDAKFPVLEKCLAEANLCFLSAPNHHPAMKHVAEARKQLKHRTIFNLVGPLTNPANVKNHLIGVYSLDWLGPMAEVLKSLGSEAAWLAHGHDGMDEITTTDETDVVELHQDMIRHFTLEPQQVGLPRAKLDQLKGGDAAQNAAALKKLLQGDKGPYRDIVLFNAAAALRVARKVEDLKQGVHLASSVLDNGAVQRTLDKLVQITNG